MPTTRRCVEQLEARLDEPLLLEGVADLHVGSLGRLGLGVVAEPGRRQDAHPADAVAAGARPEQHGQISDPGRPAEDQAVDGQDAAGTAR